MRKHIGWTGPTAVALVFACCVIWPQQQSGESSGKKSGSNAGSKKTGPGTGGASGKTPSTTGGGDTSAASAPTSSPSAATIAAVSSAAPGGSPTDNTASAQKSGGDSGANVCRPVRLGPEGDPTSLQGQLDGVGGVSVKVAGVREFIMCGPPANLDVLEDAARNISAFGNRARGHETHVVRLFYFRDGKSIASAINAAAGLGTKVQSLGLDSKAQDLLIFTSESAADDRAIHDLKRWIAMIDVPKPQVTFSAWSIQLSSANWEAIQAESTSIKAMVSVFNQELQDALQQGWRYLENDNSPFLDRKFTDYLTNRYVRTPSDFPACPGERENPPSPCPTVVRVPDLCREGEYCLGYSRMFSPLQPSLTNMLIALIGARDPRSIVDGYVDCLESGKCAPAFITSSNSTKAQQAPKIDKDLTRNLEKRIKEYATVTKGDCERTDSEDYDERVRSGAVLHPRFNCFRQQLMASLGYPASHTLLRMALADFLFHYKTAELYPEEFIPWNRGASAQRLDNLFNPLLVEFNRDLTVYLRLLTSKIAQSRAADKKIDYSSEGAVTVAVLSGSPATVSTRTQSFFTVPPVFSAAQFLQAAKDAGTTDISALLSSNLTAEAAQSLMALTQSVQSKTAQVGRDLNLSITANSLSGASSAEVDVTLDSSEAGEPKYLDDKNATSSDNVSRVAVHKTTTKVRVDSLKLFEVSSFSAILTHGRSVPLLPPFIDLPYLGNLARLRLAPGTVFHRSFAIVSAVIVPTAADIANAIEFRSDLEATTLPKAEWLHAPAKDNKAKPADKPPAATTTVQAATTTVQVQQTGATSPVSVQVGCCACPACSPAPSPCPTPSPTPCGYYWIVAHYPEGISLSAPSPADSADPAAGKKESSKAPPAARLAWEAPAKALSFDVYWTKDTKDTKDPREAVPVTATSLHRRTFDDDGSKTWNNPNPVRMTMPVDTVIYSAIPTLPGNLNEFHNAKLDCFKPDADPVLCPPRLSTTPVTRFYLEH